ncbi:hypothetical protein CASFOL_027941 [Castilleja foliolosa]|uniref:Uncharacterized protein n=1 Tax=Castilleja foliolosa TaxID=1961234 RepID=A0ABD3CG88_9LAMI
MDPNPNNFPILSYVMAKLPTFNKRTSSDSDVENPPELSPKAQEPHFEIAERMPHLKNPKLIADMRRAVGDVAQTRSTLQALGTRPDHETIDKARFRLSQIDGQSSKELQEEYKLLKSVIALDEMHGAYEKMLRDGERRLEKIYEAALAGSEAIEEEGGGNGEEVIDEEVVAILKEAEAGKKVIERIDLSERKLRIVPEAFGRLKSLVVLNFSNNQLEVIPDSIAGMENLEELNLSANLLQSLPDSIGLLHKLKILNVTRNKLTALPDSISQCRMLVELDASFNALTYLPTNIGFELKDLKRLSVNLNKLRSLPSSIGEMKSLRFLYVHFNELRGLPHSIGKLTNLEILDLGSNFNDLTELPETICDLTNLKELDLSNNQIHALPDNFGRLMNLTKLNVEQNPITVPPKEIVAKGVEAVKGYMIRRWAQILREEEEKRLMHEAAKDEMNADLLTRSSSWLNNVVTNVSGYLSPRKSDTDAYLNQQL